MNFSILQSLYKNDNSKYLKECFDFLAKQTVQPYKIILVKDGPIPSELESIIENWSTLLPIQVVGYETNQGLAHALNYGLQFVETDLVARMDSDDICFPDRFEKQLKFFEENPDTEILGAGILEFYENSDGTIFRRPRLYPEIVDNNSKCLFKGTPLGHPTLMIKTSLLKEFKYNENTSMNEDIDLWFRLIKAGHIIHNIQEPLLNFRITDGTFKRRHFEKAINEYKIYRNNLHELFGLSLKQIYPFLRLCTRFLPACFIKKLYFSKTRNKVLNSNRENN